MPWSLPHLKCVQFAPFSSIRARQSAPPEHQQATLSQSYLSSLGFAANAAGRPLIIYYRRYATAPGHFQSFVRHHECCHHAGHGNEISANCCAIRRMGLSKSGAAALRNYIVSRDVNSETARDYKGQGALFWGKTESRCFGG